MMQELVPAHNLATVSTKGDIMKLKNGDKVRILDWVSNVSEAEYEIVSCKCDSKGLIELKDLHGKSLKVIKRRIVPPSTDGYAVVIESGAKFKAVCPACPNVFEVVPNNTQIKCAEHGIYKLHWLGEKPMTEATTESKTTEETTAVKKPTAAKKPKPTREPIKVDIEQLKGLSDCELWRKSTVNFNHEKISVVSYALLCVNGVDRKLCFNTYDGTLGKRCTEPLPITDFIADKKDDEKVKWHPIKDLDKERAALAKKGYEQV
jgi:hypothetical protein